MSTVLDTARHVLASHAFGEVATTWHAAADCIAIGARAAPDLARFALLVDEATRQVLADNADVSDDSPEAEYRACAIDLRRRLGLVTP